MVTVVMAFELCITTLSAQLDATEIDSRSPSELQWWQICTLEFTLKQMHWRPCQKPPSIWYALSCASASASLSLVMELIYVLFYLETIDTKNCLFILWRAL